MSTHTVSIVHRCTFRHDPDPDTKATQRIQLHGFTIAEHSFWQCRKCQLYFKEVVWDLFYKTENNFPTEITLEQYREIFITQCL